MFAHFNNLKTARRPDSGTRPLAAAIPLMVLFVSLIMISSGAAQVQFVAPTIPSPGGNLILTDVDGHTAASAFQNSNSNLRFTQSTDSEESAGRFGLNPRLISAQSEDFGVRQSPSFTDFVTPRSHNSQPPAQGASPDTSQLESIEGIEGSAGTFGTLSFGQSDENDAIPHTTFRQPTESIGQREVIRQRYPDGKTQIEREVAQDEEGNYFNHGLWRVLSRKGNTIAQGQYEKGIMSGQWTRQHTKESSGLFSTPPFNLFQGPFTSTATFESGRLNGLWTLTDYYERQIFAVPYVDGQREGTATWWYPSQNKMREVTFDSGVINGSLLEWDQQNKLARDEQFIDGRKVIRNTTFYRPKQKSSEKFYLDGKLETEGDDDWWDAQPAPMVTTGERVQHGPEFLWHDNGNPKMKGQYKNGVRVGRFAWWHDNGNKRLEGDYDDEGEKEGLWTWRHENGMKAIEGGYEDNEAVGTWRWWNADGKVETVEEFSDGGPSTPSSEFGDSENPESLPVGDWEDGESTNGDREIEFPTLQRSDENRLPAENESRELEGIDPFSGAEELPAFEDRKEDRKEDQNSNESKSGSSGLFDIPTVPGETPAADTEFGLPLEAPDSEGALDSSGIDLFGARTKRMESVSMESVSIESVLKDSKIDDEFWSKPIVEDDAKSIPENFFHDG